MAIHVSKGGTRGRSHLKEREKGEDLFKKPIREPAGGLRKKPWLPKRGQGPFFCPEPLWFPNVEGGGKGPSGKKKNDLDENAFDSQKEGDRL